MDASAPTAREAYLGFKPQKELLYNKFLPYAEKLDVESQELLVAIKENLGRACILREVNPGVTYWTWQLVKYIQLYGRKFSKSDHIAFIKLAYELIIIPELEMDVIQQLAHLLSLLLKKRELISRDDLQLPWRPLYELYERILYSPYEHMEMLLLPATMESTLKVLIRSCRIYFTADSTQEMLDEWRPLLCPFDIAMNKGMSYFDIFLPTRLPPNEHSKGYLLWFDEFMEIWQSSHNSPLWENNMVWLFSRLAAANIGYINWDKYMPAIFTRFLRSLNLPGGFSGIQVQQGHSTYETNAIVIWIVSMLGGGSRCQEHVDHLFKMLESYYHPSNNGKWIVKLQKLLSKLPAILVKRIHDERYKKSSWQTPIPDSHKLTNEDVTKLVASMKNVVFLAIFSKGGSGDSATALKNLSLLRPETMIPPLLDRLYSALETLTEPHRLVATLHCMVAVSRSLVKGGKYFPEGPSHVLPLLTSSLPGIDPNDIKKCMVTFQFISTFTTLVPLIDCSEAVNYRNDLTPLEYDLCLATAQFEDFILQFMDRCFILIENSSLENTSRLDRETEKMNAEESILGVALSSTFTSILSQSSPEILKAAVRKLSAFIANHILEIKVSGKLAANMCRSASRVDAQSSLQAFLPHTSRLVLSLTDSDDVLKEEKLDDELLFNLLVLSEIVRCDGKQLLQYSDAIKKVLRRTLQLTSKQGYTLACSLLRHTLRALTMTYALEFRSVPRPESPATNENEAFKDYLPIRDWGKPGNVDDLKIQWHIPSEEELTLAVDIMEEFMKPELEKLDNFSSGQKDLTREELLQSLTITLDCILGAGEALPLWSEENINIIESCVPLHFLRVRQTNLVGINFRDGSNIRQVTANVVSRVMEKIFQVLEDDTKSLFVVVKLYKSIMFHWGVAREDFDKRWKGFHVVKRALEDKISGVKKHIRGLLVDRAVLQHESRLQEKSKCPFTLLHKRMTEDLLKLSISHYSQVRIRAQNVVQLCLQNFPFSYRIFIPQIVVSLQKDPKENHEEFKGSLYFLIGQKQNTILTVTDWEVISQVWPALVASLPSEKPSIIRLIDHISESIRKYLETIQIGLEVPDTTVERAKSLWVSGHPIPQKPIPSDEEISNGILSLDKLSRENLELYHKTIEAVLNLAESGNLHWRHYNLATIMMGLLIRHDVQSSPRTVRYYVRNLIHETLAIRKISISVVAAVLKQQKRQHAKRVLKIEDIPEDSPISSKLQSFTGKVTAKSSVRPGTNLWMQYNSSLFPDTQEKWNSSIFIHKTHIGFYEWPKPFQVYDTDDKQPKLNRQLEELRDIEVPIYQSFTDPQFIKSLVKFLSLEERKGHDKFNAKRFYFFKGLFRNFGDTFLPLFLPHLKELVSDIQESNQRCAAEILAGLLRGSKHWPFETMMKLKDELVPILSIAFEKITPETVGDWGTCIATASESRDPNKYYWLFELLMDNPIRGEGGSFLESSRLYLLLGVLAQQEWRIFELLHRLLEYLEPHMTHGFQNVREKLGSILCTIFLYDIQIPSAADCLQLAPKKSNFISKVYGEMKILSTENHHGKNDKLVVVSDAENNRVDQDFMSKERKDAVNLFKTICKWLMSSIPRTVHSVPKEIYTFLPLLCTLKSDTTDDELQLDCVYTLAMLGHAMILPDSTEKAIETIRDITEKSNWHARSSALSFMQLMVFSNMFNIMDNDKWVAEIGALVLKLLGDEQLEVRECAAECLGGLLHCEFMKVTDELLNQFKMSCNIKLRKKKQAQNSAASKATDATDLIKRHGGVLGLCACVNAYPYDVPDFLPEILVILGDHLNDPQPIPTTVKKTLSNFRRTHHDNWRDHKLKFTDDQLVVITDLLVSPSYYA